MSGAERIHEVLSEYIGHDAIVSGITAIEKLHLSFIDLLNRRHELVDLCGPSDDGYSDWFCYRLTPAVEEIGQEGWVERHLWDVSRLATSHALGPCCRRTLAEAFGVEALHVAIQAHANSDGMIQQLCHQPGDRRQWLRRSAGELTMHIVAFGNYPPPGLSEPGRTTCRQAGWGVFDAQPFR